VFGRQGSDVAYLSDHCTPVTAASSRHIRSVNRHQLTVPRCRRITFGRRAFSVVGPTVWKTGTHASITSVYSAH